jgi:transketolase
LDEEAILKSLEKKQNASLQLKSIIFWVVLAKAFQFCLGPLQEFVAVNVSFGESGTPEQLMDKYKLNNQAIVEAVERVMKENNLFI